jgi:dTDP-4-dehydrorhamnose reductase
MHSLVELWAGVECTVNRVGNQYFDQLERNGHATRIDDLDLFASLGIKAIRYPVLWERTAPNGLQQANWSWADVRLQRLHELDIRPIIGLLHHGSGPCHTSLVDADFPEKLAEFAHAVAKRYPWVDSYTPVNEPLTTARFSGMYGHWYPHGRDDLTFARALLMQCRAIVLSMQAIREVNPDAQLVQTEDLGTIYSTPFLAYQAELENERRWLSFDLLCGCLTRDRPMWDYLCSCGVEEAELSWFLDNPCPPDVLGINHYVYSDRLLDERLERYPPQFHGGNGKHAYTDIEAVHVIAEEPTYPTRLLQETWERYGRTIAVTEAHLGSTREEQMRWLKEIWDAAKSLRLQGVDVRAVTVWSLLGTYDWDCLVTRVNGHYESGVFDVRSPQPRSTALTQMLREFAVGQEPNHPLLDVPGWWRRPERLFYPPVNCCSNKFPSNTADVKFPIANSELIRPLAIVGATGTLGKAFARVCDSRGIPYCLLTHQAMDITNPVSVNCVLTQLKPWAVVNAAEYVRVDDAEWESHLCHHINADGAAILATACLEQEIGLVTFSSDLVFDGNCAVPYLESDTVAPLNVYGHSKVMAERWVLATHPCSLVIRTSAIFGPWDEYNFLALALGSLASGRLFVALDTVVSPTYVPDLVNATLDLLIDGECGLWHLTNSGAISWADFARYAANKAGLNANLIESGSATALGLVAPRPAYSALGSERGSLLPDLDRAIACYLYTHE